VSEVARSLEESLGRILSNEALLHAAEHDAPLDDALQRDLVALGWAGVWLDDSGLDVDDRIRLAAVAGRRLLPAAIRAESLILAPLLDRAGDARLAGLLDGSLRGGGGVASGDEALVALAPGAVVAGVLGPGWGALVELDEVEPVAGLEAGQGLARVCVAARFEGVEDIRRGWELGVLGELYGVAQRALELSVRYANEREQFGRPISSFQAVSHRLARMAVDLEALDAAIGRLAARADARLAAVLRFAGPAAARRVVESAIQVHGGMGFTWELGLHLHYRRVLDLQAMLGGPDATLQELGALVLDA
jgi:hypothetical protein